MRQFSRADRVRNQMLRDVRQLLEEELAAHVQGMVTFTDVEITKDLKLATIYYSHLGTDIGRLKAANYLSKIRPRVQGQMGRLLSIKMIPEIRFRYDKSIAQGMKIEELLIEIAKEKKKTDEEDT